MHDNDLLALAAIFFLGVSSQWLAWKLKLPAIVALIATGLLVGPVSGWLSPDEILGKLLQPAVALSVAIILFEGGLSLRFADLKDSEAFGAMRRLVLLGSLVTWAAVTFLAVVSLQFPLELSLLLAAILVVTGPTVILPLLRQVRLGGRVKTILKWEGMINDPLGAVLAIVVFEAIRGGEISNFQSIAVSGFFRTLVLSLIGGGLAAWLLVLALRKYWLPDHLQAALAFGSALFLYSLCDVAQPESGLAAVTVFGFLLAQAKGVSLRHIRAFKEDLSVLLISTLFVVLSARIQPEELYSIEGRWIAFAALVILVVRPLTVLVSTAGVVLSWKEKLYLCAIGPRGIVAAAIASVFSLELRETNYQGSEHLMMVTFLVIVGSVVWSGLVAAPLARALGLSHSGKGTLLMVGAHDRARYLAKSLVEGGVSVLMVDRDSTKVAEAQEEGLEAICFDVLSSDMDEYLDFTDIGAMLAVLRNDEVNTLAVLKFRHELGAANVFRILSKRGSHAEAGRAFGGLTRAELDRSWDEGYRPRVIEIDNDTGEVRALVVLDEKGDWDVMDGKRKLTPGDRVVALAHECWDPV